MSNIFTGFNVNKPSSNTFDLSHERKLSLNMGRLVPINLMEVIPGDKFRIQTSQLVRFAPMLAPMMHTVNVYVHYFFVPNRILWDGWEDFITGGSDGTSSRTFPYWQLESTGKEGTMADHLGYPINADYGDSSALPLAGYLTIYNEYYRDQNLQPEIDTELIDGDNTAQPAAFYFDKTPLHRAWQHDYFTSALPWTQRGPEATIPLGTTAPIIFDHTMNQPASFGKRISDGSVMTNATPTTGAAGELELDGTDSAWDVSGSHYTDLSGATASSIIDLRRAFKLQEWLEKNARGGARYTESLMIHFGVRSQDSRLQRPEFLGGSTSPVSISEVLQTSSNSAQPSPQGNMAGHAISTGANRPVTYTAQEHGYIHGIMSVMPKPDYFQGLPRHLFKFDKFDYYWPSFAHIGEQAIYNKELYMQGAGAPEDDEVFGYTPRYAEYKYIPNTVHGEFRTSLDFWHMARKFTSLPPLNSDFIRCDPTTRIFAVTQAEQLYAHVYNKVKARRSMPYFGNPKM